MKINFLSFTIHIIEGYISSLYLVEYDDGMLLLDGGCVNDVKRIEDYCKLVLNRSPSDIKLAVVSHMHPDHAGGAVALRKKYGIAIAAHKDVDLWYSGVGG
jgi:glyoxylase-like metal-dependent hydrolase (beta-lactamase superfamily II)